jgi:zinc transporter ZupT
VANVTAPVLSFAAGSFLYIGATDLLPGIHAGRSSADRRARLFGFAAGVALLAAVSALEA